MPIYPSRPRAFPLVLCLGLSMLADDADGALDFDNLKSRNPTPPAAHISEVTHQNGRWIMGSDGGYITHSADGENWSTVTVEYGKGIEAIIYWDGRYFAGGVDSRTLLESTDLVNWAPLSVFGTDFPFNLKEFHFAFGKLHAVGYSPGIAVTTTGADWTEVAVPVEDGRFESMASNGTRAVLVGSDGLILTSENGTDWTVRPVTIPDIENTIDDDFLVVRWVNGQFVAGGKQGLIATSPDGILWSHRATDFDDWIYNVLAVDGIYLLTGRRGSLRTTTDFLSWDEIDTGSSQDVEDIFRAGDRIVAGGRDGSVSFSDNLTEWTSTNGGSRGNLGEVTFGAGSYLVSDFNGTIFKSNDSEGWTSAYEDPDNAYAVGLFWDGARFVAMTQRGHVLTSPDGEIWGRSDPVLSTNRINGFGWANGHYWAVTDDGIIASSDDLITWSEQSVGAFSLTEVCYGAGLYLAVGQTADRSNAAIFTSPDGVTWTERDGGFPLDNQLALYSCVYGNGRFVVGGSNRSISHSTDGINWTHETSFSTPRIVSRLILGDGELIALSVSGSIWRSADAVTWTQKRLRTTQGIQDCIEAGGRTVVVGTNGTILSTDLNLGNTFAAWKAERFSPAQQADPRISDPGMDPDKDGRSNAFEYFSNTQPLVAEEGGPYSFTKVVKDGTDSFGFTIRRSTDLAGVSLKIAHTSDLATWSELTGPQIEEMYVTPLDENTEEVLYRIDATIDSTSADFLQVEVVIEE